MKFLLLLGSLLLSVATSLAEEPTMMKAVVVHHYGAPEVATYEDTPRPVPKDDEALIRVIAAGVNPADPLIVSGKYAKEFGTSLPLIPGYDVAGVVAQAGKKVTKLKVGDEVYGYPLMGGGWAEYAVVKEDEVSAKPAGLSYVEAAAVPLAALTAWNALVEVAKLEPGQKVLIHGGSGGVGSYAVQIAKARGAFVIATASTANQAFLKELGCDLALDYTRQRFEDAAKEVDVVLDPVGGETLARSYAVVKKGGIVCTLVARLDGAELEKYHIRGAGIAVTPSSANQMQLTALIAEKKLKPYVTQVLPLSEGVKALQQAETHHTRGKIVLQIAPEPQP